MIISIFIPSHKIAPTDEVIQIKFLKINKIGLR